MLCLKCKNEQFTEKVVNVPQTFRGEEFKVKAPAMVCANCAWFTMNDPQADHLCLITADAYRHAHGLLSSAEIIACRKACEMSQRQFAKFLRVGEASVKRWETGAVQEPLYDELIRRKCELVKVPATWVDVLVIEGHTSRFKTFTVVNATKYASRRGSTMFTSAVSTAAKQGTFKIQLSDGHSWRDEHLNTNDSTLPSTA